MGGGGEGEEVGGRAGGHMFLICYEISEIESLIISIVHSLLELYTWGINFVLVCWYMIRLCACITWPVIRF